MLLMGVTRPGSEWWHMKLYTQTPNRLGTPAMLELGGCREHTTSVQFRPVK